MPSRPSTRPRPAFAVALTGLALLAIARITLEPLPLAEEQAATTPLVCLVCGAVGAVDVLYNLLMFVPLGVGLRWLGLGAGRVILFAFLCTLSIETAQLTLVAGRDASLSDLLTNTAGGGLGIVVADALPVILWPSGRAALLFLGLAGLLPVGALAGAAWLLGPSPPPTLWFGQWAPDIGMYEHYRGRVLSASLQGGPMPSRALPGLDTRIGWRERPLELSAVFTKAGPRAGIAPIVSVFDRNHTKVAFLGQESGTRLRFEPRIRSEDLRFRPLSVAFVGALDVPEGDTLGARARFDGRTVRLSVEHGSRTRTHEVQLSPALGWALLAPIGGTVDDDTRLYSAGWLALLWLPLGYYRVRARPGSLVAAAGIATGLAAGLTTGITAIAGLPFNHWSELAAAGSGALAGLTLARLTQRVADKHERPTRR